MTAQELLAAYANGQRDFTGADPYGASLTKANLTGATLPHFQICPEVGAFIGFKKLCGDCVCEVEIDADTPRTSSLVGRKCRAMAVTVRGIYDRNGTSYDVGKGVYNGTVYRVGEVVVADDWDDDIRVECTHGIHFFMTLAEAWEY